MRLVEPIKRRLAAIVEIDKGFYELEEILILQALFKQPIDMNFKEVLLVSVNLLERRLDVL